MWCGIISIFPEMFSGFLQQGMVYQAQKKGLLTCELFNPRTFTAHKQQMVDDRPFGGGPGMVLMAEPLQKAVRCAEGQAPSKTHVVYLSPDGEKLDANLARQLSKQKSLVLVAGRYEGVDQRFIENEVHQIVSIGDFVLTGGELASMVVLDSVCRFIPGVLGDEASYQQDAFSVENDGLLDCPHYTRPADFNGHKVPDVLLSGDHQAIARWRKKQKLGRTWQFRPDLIELSKLSHEDKALLKEFQSDLDC